MKCLFFFTCSILLLCVPTRAQTNQTDSIFALFKLKYSPEVLKAAKLEYEQANDTMRAILNQIYKMPMSSRAEMMENFEQNSSFILDLKNEFSNSVPKGYLVSLEIRMDDSPLRNIEGIDMHIFKDNKTQEPDLIATEWDVEYASSELDSLLSIVRWDPMTFSNIKNLMQVSNCISIENTKEYVEIGFSHSGLGKYSYLIFPTKLETIDQIAEYNDGCKYKFYKENIVLKYTGGLIGPQCFTD